MAAQLMQLVDVLGGVKSTLDAGNINDDTLAQVMKTLVESTGTAWTVIKTSFDVHEAKAHETMQQLSSVVNTTSAQGIVMRQHQHHIGDMNRKCRLRLVQQCQRHTMYLTARHLQA